MEDKELPCCGAFREGPRAVYPLRRHHCSSKTLFCMTLPECYGTAGQEPGATEDEWKSSRPQGAPQTHALPLMRDIDRVSGRGIVGLLTGIWHSFFCLLILLWKNYPSQLSVSRGSSGRPLWSRELVSGRTCGNNCSYETQSVVLV